ncbi:MAG TPA: hypothetical protein VGS79_23540 [Puia sp.]|nr:hypothetical protein [Puia sp.]
MEKLLMPIGKRFLVCTGLLLLLGMVNFLFRKKVRTAYADLLSYNSLYAVKEQFNITYLGRLGNDSILMRFGGGDISVQNDFQVFCGDKKISETRASELRMRPYPAVNRYKVKVNHRDSFDIQIEMFHGDTIPWFSLSKPVLNADLHSVADWAWKVTPDLTAGDDEDFARRILKDSMQTTPELTSREKVLRIAKYLLSRTVEKRGTPADTMADISPLAQWRCVLSGRSLLYCANYSVIMAYFSNLAGVPCRIIECGSQVNGLANEDHMFNEVYLAEEGQWAYVDLMDANVFVQKNGHLLNAIDVQRLLRYDGPDPGFTALHYQGDSLVELPFREASWIARESFNPNTGFVFYYGNYSRLVKSRNLLEKLRNFLYTKAWYALYSDGADLPGYAFYIRLGTQIAFIAGLLVWLLWIGLQGLQISQIRFRR